MAVTTGNLYDALRSAGADDDKARKAAGYEHRFSKAGTNVALLKWMVGCEIALTVAIVGKLFFVH